MRTTDFIGTKLTVTIDRAMGTHHPEHGFVYPVNYGFILGVPAPDGEDLDAYVLGVAKPLENFTGTCVAVIHRMDDDDDKVVLVPAGTTLTDEEIRAATYFQEQFFKSTIIREAQQPGA